MEGLAIVYAPKSGTAGGAVLMDYADKFPKTVNSMFARPKRDLEHPHLLFVRPGPPNGTVVSSLLSISY
jgi:hypothetical protein